MELLSQWHSTKNKGLTPETISYGSRKKVWWQCAHGHEWQAIVAARKSGNGCPVCANQVIVPGENDLATMQPELAGQWHPEKNGHLTPDMVCDGSNRKVWWRCAKGHEWQAMVYSRALGGSGCPVCAGKQIVSGENDLATAHPEIAKEWHPTKNEMLRPDEVAVCSNKKVWWICDKGHEYQTIVADRTSQKTGCPYCTGRKVFPGFNDLATVNPDVASQWHPTLNGDLTPGQVTRGCHKSVWWECPEGHVWKAVIFSRTGKKSAGCPVCVGKVKAKK